MSSVSKTRTADLERRELQLTLFACLAIGVLAIGTAVLMYPLVFSEQSTADKNTRVAFFGFCVLCLLLAGYLWDRQRIVRQLRTEMAEDRRRALEAEAQANRELLKSMPKLNAFQDSLPMEFRRTAATGSKLSILVLTVNMPEPVDAMRATAALCEAAKVVSRKLREADSMYILGPACIGAVLPAADVEVAKRVAASIREGVAALAASGVTFSSTLKIVNYPADAGSAHELQQAVRALIPTDHSMQAIAAEVLI
jgi:GGDEF domain-containing protein